MFIYKLKPKEGGCNMISEVMLTRMEIRTKILEEEYSIDFELLKKENQVWGCKFPSKMSLECVALAIVELFCLEKIKVNYISFEFMEVKMGVSYYELSEGTEYEDVLSSIAKQLQN